MFSDKKFWYFSEIIFRYYFCSKHRLWVLVRTASARRGGSYKYLQSMFLSRNKKNNVYPCKPQFSYIKVGFKRVKLYRYVFVMDIRHQSMRSRTYIELYFKAASEWHALRLRFRASKTGLRNPEPHLTPVVFVLSVPRRFLCCSWFFGRRRFHIWCWSLFFLLFPSFVPREGGALWLWHFLRTCILLSLANQSWKDNRLSVIPLWSIID